MKIHELLRLLLIPLLLLCVLLVLITFITYFVQGSSGLLDYLLGIVDLREERTIGTWFETLLFALTGLTFFLVSRHPALPAIGKILLVLTALGFCFLSADEALALHEFMGYQLEQATGMVDDTALAERGYSWVLLYAPAALALFGLLLFFYHRIFRTLEKTAARTLFFAGWAAVGAVVFFEAIEGWSVFSRTDGLAMLTCFEEMFELTALLLLYTANLRIAEEADL